MNDLRVAYVTANANLFRESIASLPFAVVTIPNAADDATKLRLLRDVEVVIGVFPALSETVLRGAQRLRFIQLLHAGYEMMNLPLLAELGIGCATSGNVNSPAVAELTIALMLAVNRRLVAADGELRAGAWARQGGATDAYTHGELFDKTIGLLGLGHIGLAVAQRLRGFDCRLLYHKPHRLPPETEKSLALDYVPLAELYAAADILSVHAALTPATRHLVDRAAFARMKPSAVLINTARGAVVDEAALIEALAAGRIAGAGLDVFDPEPPAPAIRFWPWARCC